MARTERIPAIDIVIGDVIVCPNGTSITVENIERITREGGDDLIDFAGTQTFYSFDGNEQQPNGLYGAFWDDLVTVLARA